MKLYKQCGNSGPVLRKKPAVKNITAGLAEDSGNSGLNLVESYPGGIIARAVDSIDRVVVVCSGSSGGIDIVRFIAVIHNFTVIPVRGSGTCLSDHNDFVEIFVYGIDPLQRIVGSRT
jgi:hypothetical protein